MFTSLHMSHVTLYMSHVLCHMSLVMFQLSPVTCHYQTEKARYLKWENERMFTCHYLSHGTCRILSVTRHNSFSSSSDSGVELVGGGSVINWATQSNLCTSVPPSDRIKWVLNTCVTPIHLLDYFISQWYSNV